MWLLGNLEMKGQLQLFEPLKKTQCSNHGDFDWPPFCYDLSFGLMGSFQLIEVGRWVAVLMSRISYPALRFSAVKPKVSCRFLDSRSRG